MRFRLFIFHLINLNLNWGFGVLILNAHSPKIWFVEQANSNNVACLLPHMILKEDMFADKKDFKLTC